MTWILGVGIGSLVLVLIDFATDIEVVDGDDNLHIHGSNDIFIALSTHSTKKLTKRNGINSHYPSIADSFPLSSTGATERAAPSPRLRA